MGDAGIRLGISNSGLRIGLRSAVAAASLDGMKIFRFESTEGATLYGTGSGTLLQVMEGDMRHNPVADPGEDCINLAVTTAPLKFESLLQKIVAPLFGF